jgi:hypothetical protein
MDNGKIGTAMPKPIKKKRNLINDGTIYINVS